MLRIAFFHLLYPLHLGDKSLSGLLASSIDYSRGGPGFVCLFLWSVGVPLCRPADQEIHSLVAGHQLSTSQ